MQTLVGFFEDDWNDAQPIGDVDIELMLKKDRARDAEWQKKNSRSNTARAYSAECVRDSSCRDLTVELEKEDHLASAVPAPSSPPKPLGPRPST